MENAVEALKLAGWVLIFVVALSIIMNAFSLARQSVDAIITYSDREYLAEYVAESNTTERIVGFESIIPAVYRAFKDNYKVVFPNYTLYTDNNETDSTKKYKHSIDKATLNLQDNKIAEEFINKVFYGSNDTGYDLKYFQGIKFNLYENGLYKQIQGKKFKESLGVYDPAESENGRTQSPNANKTKRRVITYEELTN